MRNLSIMDFCIFMFLIYFHSLQYPTRKPDDRHVDDLSATVGALISLSTRILHRYIDTPVRRQLTLVLADW